MNRRAMMGDILETLVILLVIVPVIIVAGILLANMNKSVKEYKITASAQQYYAANVALGYLRTPYQNATVQDSNDPGTELRTLIIRDNNLLGYNAFGATLIRGSKSDGLVPPPAQSTIREDFALPGSSSILAFYSSPARTSKVTNAERDAESIRQATEKLSAGQKVLSVDGARAYVFWGQRDDIMPSIGGIWSVDGLPCLTQLTGGKVVCRNGYKPKMPDDAGCFVTNEDLKLNGLLPEGCTAKGSGK